MDKELLALAEEYSKYNKELPSLRSEYNFLIEDIDRKKLVLEAVSKQHQSKLAELQTEEDRLASLKRDVDIYVSEKEEYIKNKLKKQEDSLLVVIEQSKIAISKQDASKKELDKKSIEINEFAATEKTRLDAKEKELNKKSAELEIKEKEQQTKEQELSQFVSSINEKKNALELLEQTLPTREQKIIKQSEIIKQEMTVYLDLKDKVTKDKKEVDVKLAKIAEAELKLADANAVLQIREAWLLHKEKIIEEKQYKLEVKEADLVNEENRLILFAKKVKNAW